MRTRSSTHRESAPEGTSLTKNEHLSLLVDTLLNLIRSPEQKVRVTKLSSYPLKLVLLGKRFSGKHSLAKKLAEYCSLKIVEVDDVVQAAIK